MLNFQDFTRPFGPNTSNQYASAALPSFANVAGSAFNWDATNNQTASQERVANNRLAGDATSGLMAGYGDIGRSLAGLYGGYGTNLTNLLSNQMGAYGQAEMARQVGLANAATAAMSGLGQASAGAMGAWGANQAAWAKAMADSQVANQQALAQYGVGRDSALASLGGSGASLGGALGQAYSGLGSQTAAARAGLGGSLGQSYGALLSGLGNNSAQLGSSLSTASGNLYGTLGSAAGGVGNASAAALGGLYGTLGSAAGGVGAALGTAQGGLGASANQALGSYGSAATNSRGQTLAGFNNADLAAYQAGLNYNRDFAKLGLARELGVGQLGVASQIAGGFSGAPAGGGANLSAGGSPLAFAQGTYSGGAGGGGAGGGSGGGGFTPPTGREWYQDPYYAEPFPSGLPFANTAMDFQDAAVMGNVRGATDAASQRLANVGRANYAQLDRLGGSGSRGIQGNAQSSLNALGRMGAAGAQNINRAGQSGFQRIDDMRMAGEGGFSNLAALGFGGMDGDFAAASDGIARSGDQAFSELARNRRAVSGTSILDALSRSAMDSQRGLQDAYYSSQTMPSMLLGQTMSGLQGMMRSNTGSMNRGMNQFYDSLMAPVAMGRNDLAAGVQAGSGLLTGLADRMQSAATAARQAQVAAQGRARTSGGGTNDMLSRVLPTAVEQERQRQQVAQMQRMDRQRQIAELTAERERIINGPQTGPYGNRYSPRVIAINHELARLNRQF